MTVAEEIAAPNWRCLRCDVWNAPDDDPCMVCETDRATATDASALVPVAQGARTPGTGRRGPTPNPPRGHHPAAAPPGRPGAPWVPRHPGGVPPAAHPAGMHAPHPAGMHAPHPAGMHVRPPVPPGPTGEVFFPPVPPPRPPMAPPWAPGGPPRGLPPAPGPGMRPLGHVRSGWQPTDLTVPRVVGIGCGGLLMLYFLLVGCATLISALPGSG